MKFKMHNLFILTTFLFSSCLTTSIPILPRLEGSNSHIPKVDLKSQFTFTSSLTSDSIKGLNKNKRSTIDTGSFIVNENEILEKMINKYLNTKIQIANSENYINIHLNSFEIYIYPISSNGETVFKAFLGGDISRMTKALLNVTVTAQIEGKEFSKTIEAEYEQIYTTHMSNTMNGQLAYYIENAAYKNVPIEIIHGININEVNNKVIQEIGKFLDEIIL